ncbi:MAG TPA: hypothetical protein VHE78_04685 [Gemmatimonadaceae bacterium]|nr:hypothetical protein [Gemmatimonadaceae bacterium]
MNDGKRCGDAGGMTKGGKPCASEMNLGTTGLCIQHDAARAVERAAVQAAGGKASAVSKRLAKAALPEDCPRAPKNLEDAVHFLSWLSRAVTVGAIDARTAHEAAYALAGFRAAVEKRDLLRKIADLTAELNASKKSHHHPRNA